MIDWVEEPPPPPELFAAHGPFQVDLNLVSQHLMTIKVVSGTAPHVFY